VIVKSNPVHHSLRSLSSGGKFASVHAGCLEPAPEALGGGVVPTVALATHGCAHLPRLEGVLKFLAAVLASPVAVKDQAWLGLAPESSHGQGVFDQARLHVRLKAPAHHLAAEEIDHRSQIHLQPRDLRSHPSQLHLLGRDHRGLIPSTLQLTLVVRTHPRPQRGLGNA
jgi:hypothetical protein